MIASQPPAPPSLSQIEQHLRGLYAEWEQVLYPNGRLAGAASLEVRGENGHSGYDPAKDLIIIHVPELNQEDYEGRLGTKDIQPNKNVRPIGETEVLHEMLHEIQFKELTEPTPEGTRLYQKHGPYFSGPGHDEKFFSAIVDAAGLLNLAPDDLLGEL